MATSFNVLVQLQGQGHTGVAPGYDADTEEGVRAALWDPRVLKPVDKEMIRSIIDFPLLVTIEDGTRVGGFGSLVADALQRRSGPIPRLLQIGTPDDYLPHGTESELHTELGLDASGIAAQIIKAIKSNQQ